MKLDILAFGAHPDDVELSCSGTILKHIRLGMKAGIVDLTNGEMGTRGNADLRNEEAAVAGKILGISTRENMNFADGFFQNDKAHQLKIISVIRKYTPEIILCNAIADRHPDHGKASKLISDAVFLAGLVKVETLLDGKKQEPWNTKAVYHYIQERYLQPDFVTDITDFIEVKMQAIKAYRSQFYNPNSNERETAISSKEYLEFIESRAMEMGSKINVPYAEGFTIDRVPGVNSLFDLL